ncbi:unnamed protein product [Rhizophagus irregularis]|uniref:Uncharacterized protein n=1 Tax=Rhizophagus irregularis TaxID=588596 RepID=A0A2I1HB51_9GLOM|nr:hypothetical protein RhiirA4_474817 [Rhizophagus irregularis]PKY56070.1 hypothetical protein RhiirA4_476085 [Rhizophagus irregularis]CAB4412282.1 unnamed protein product [Rhizophagus irregularis]
MEEKFQKGGSNIALTRNDRTYFFRMFDVKLDASAIKRRYEWQAYKKLDKGDLEKVDHEINIMQNTAIYNSTMKEDKIGDGLKIKLQDELIGEEGTYKKKVGSNKFKVPMQTKSKDKFVDAR